MKLWRYNMNIFVSGVLDKLENREINVDEAMALFKRHKSEHKQAKKIKIYIKDKDKKVFSLPAMPLGFLRAVGSLALYFTKLGAVYSKDMGESVRKLLKSLTTEDLKRITDSLSCHGNFSIVDVISDEGELVKIDLL